MKFSNGDCLYRCSYVPSGFLHGNYLQQAGDLYELIDEIESGYYLVNIETGVSLFIYKPAGIYFHKHNDESL